MVLGRKKLKSRRPLASSNGICSVTLARRFDCSPDRVFDAWLDPAKARKFLFATPGGEMTRCEINAIPAGRFLIVERREGEEVEHLGEYTEILRPSRLAFTWTWEGDDTRQSLVTLNFREVSGKTEMTLRQEGLGTIESRDGHGKGWNSALNKLERHLARRAA